MSPPENKQNTVNLENSTRGGPVSCTVQSEKKFELLLYNTTQKHFVSNEPSDRARTNSINETIISHWSKHFIPQGCLGTLVTNEYTFYLVLLNTVHEPQIQ